MNAPRLSVGKTFLLSLLFAAVFSGVYASVRDTALVSAGVENPLVKRVFFDYGYAVGPALALLFYLVFLLAAGLKNAVGLKRFVSGNAVVATLTFAPVIAFSYFLVTYEPRHTEIARAIIDFFGKPLLSASLAACAVAFAFAVLGIVLKNPAETSGK